MAHSKYRGRAEERVPGVGFKGFGMFQQRSWAKKGFRVYTVLISRCRFRVFGSEFKTFTLSLGLGCEGLGQCHVLSEVLPFILDCFFGSMYWIATVRVQEHCFPTREV